MRFLRHPVAALTVVAGLGIAPATLHAQADSAAVVGAIERFFDALRAKDTTVMRASVDSAARFTLLRPDPAGGVRVVVLTGEQFLRNASNPNSPPLDEPIRNARVLIDGDLASVWAEYQVRRDGQVSHCGHDAFHMVRRQGAWKILNVSDTFRRDGCGGMWPTGRH
jgi:ketosteroid isomerase-like protein